MVNMWKKCKYSILLAATLLIGSYGLLFFNSLEQKQTNESVLENVQNKNAQTEVAVQKIASNKNQEYAVNQQASTDLESIADLDYDQNRKDIGLNKDYVQKELSNQAGKFGFDYLENNQKVLYVEIYSILTNRATEVLISTIQQDDIEIVFQCVLNDHPEIFYVSGYTFTKYTHGDSIRRITFSGTYTLEQEEINQRKQEIEKYITNCLSGVELNDSEYDKVKYVYEYLIQHTEYELQSIDNQNICSVFLNGKSVCQGYAKATQLLLDRLGIHSTLVIGTVENGEGHAWNLVQVDGAYYYVDTTWGDAYYVLGESEYDYPTEKMPSINYDYLLVTTEQLEQTHTIENIVPMPRCISTEANYYAREGAYFDTLDRERIGVLFEKAYTEGKEFVTLKCANASVYAEVEEALLNQQEVFNYLKSKDGVIAYTNSPKQLSISFWL